MSKSLRSIKQDSPTRAQEAIERRLRSGTGGLGFWAAVDARKISLPQAKTMLKDKSKK